MKIINVTLLIVLLSFILSGCSKVQPEPKVEYIYKKEYIYLACTNDNKAYESNMYELSEAYSPSKEDVKRQPESKPIKNLAIQKHQKIKLKYKQPKKTKIYAPSKYITRPNKKMDFMIGINKDGSEFVYLEGEFGENTYINFIEFIKKLNTSAIEIKINSNGGLLSTAMQIGAYVKEHRWDTGLDKEMLCYSACSFVYFSGNEKSLQGKAKVGLHRPYLPEVKDTLQSIRKVKRDYISYWNYIRAPKSIYDEMMAVDRDNLFILDRSNINDYIDVKIK